MVLSSVVTVPGVVVTEVASLVEPATAVVGADSAGSSAGENNAKRTTLTTARMAATAAPAANGEGSRAGMGWSVCPQGR